MSAHAAHPGGEKRPPGGIRLRGVAVTLLAAAALSATGCATKRDVRDLRAEIRTVMARQDSILVMLGGEHRALRDSIRAVGGEVVTARGELRNQLLGMEQQLIQIQELSGQSQRRLNQLREDMERRGDEPPSRDPSETGGGAAPSGVEGDDLYIAGTEQLDRGASETARLAFEQLLQENPQHPRAPDAQYNIGETYYQEGNLDAALEALDRVVQLYPDSPRAPAALYRAGVISEERGNIAEARGYFNRVLSGYPRSEQARLASDKLQTLSR
ncbi:MAG TPA: tol-pal system protein YbgF [Longimicrobiales bacterium]|nr:tol-pal system protein YbgF [Longimicrobiales bacterium]